MFKLGVGINFYDDPFGLQRILNNKDFYDLVHTFYLIDGRYAQRSDQPEHDPALVDAIIKQYEKIHYVKMFDYKQIEKRNKYWELAQEHGMDFLIVLDSDEYIWIDPDKFKDTLEICNKRKARCYPIKQDHPQVIEMPRPRLFKSPFDYRHKQSETTISHGSLYDPDGKEVINEMYEWFKDHEKRTGVDGIKIYHDKTFRTESRIIKDRIYYDEVKTR
jgi:hypothetical protein